MAIIEHNNDEYSKAVKVLLSRLLKEGKTYDEVELSSPVGKKHLFGFAIIPSGEKWDK